MIAHFHHKQLSFSCVTLAAERSLASKKFYHCAIAQRSITITSRDPSYITAAIKAKLRRMNRLMRAGRIEEASALARRIGKDIARCNETRLTHLSPRTGVKDLWAAVRHLTGRKTTLEVTDGITAESLNHHYARVSTDPGYQMPKHKLTTARCAGTEELVTENRTFAILDKLHNTQQAWTYYRHGFYVLGLRSLPDRWPACLISPLLLLRYPNSGNWHLLHQLQKLPRRRNMLTTGPSRSPLS